MLREEFLSKHGAPASALPPLRYVNTTRAITIAFITVLRY
jgi:hypothetical protein